MSGFESINGFVMILIRKNITDFLVQFIFDVSILTVSILFFCYITIFLLPVVALLDFVLKWDCLHQTSLQSHNYICPLQVYPVKKCKKVPGSHI